VREINTEIKGEDAPFGYLIQSTILKLEILTCLVVVLRIIFILMVSIMNTGIEFNIK
jgi:diacylglycerol kinase